MQKIPALLLTIVALGAFLPDVSAQYAFQDAQSIEKTLNGTPPPGSPVHIPNKAAWLAILKFYVPTKDAGDQGAIRDDFAANPFLKVDEIAPAIAGTNAPQVSPPPASADSM